MLQAADTTPSPQEKAREFYLHAMDALDAASIRYLVGGGYAMAHYTGIIRDTKDLDVFVRPGESRKAVDALGAAGYRTEWTWPHFLAKALSDNAFVDVLFNSGNGLSPVDDEWFQNATDGTMLGRPVRFVPVEEMVHSKAFVMERDRYDGADVAHLILRQGENFDWQRILRRFDGHERILLAHLIMFPYIYPSESRLIPAWVVEEAQRKIDAQPPTTEKVCGGTFLAQHQYQPDVHKWGFVDGRLAPRGPLRADDLARFAPPDAPPIG
jgi:hypothetical protein